MKKIFIIAIILLWVIPTYSSDVESLRKLVEETNDPTKRALLYKEIGDYYASVDNYREASEFYIKALSTKREVFNTKEILKMATILSWAGKFEESLKELKLVLSEDSENLEARIHYARVLSWSGRLDKALKEINIVLKKSPNERDALFVKANILRWMGNNREAIRIYNYLLEEKDDFDIRIGLIHSFVTLGDVRSAEENVKLLKPSFPYQEKELLKLEEYLRNLKRPKFYISYNYYSDNEDNILNKYLAKVDMYIGSWKFNSSYRLIQAKDKVYNNKAHSLNTDIYRKFNGVGIGVNAGVTLLDNRDSTKVLTGNIRTDFEVYKTIFFINLSRDVMTDTALLIEKKIRYEEIGLRALGPISEKVTIEGSYKFRDYSDKNNSHDLQGILRLALFLGNPSLSAGYKLRYIDFKKQSGSGYFDPNDFLSHQFFVSLYFEREKLYLFAEPYIGHQSFKRYGKKTNNFFTGGLVSLGYKIKDSTFLELNAEGGDYAAGTPAGFKYWMLGIGLKGNF